MSQNMGIFNKNQRHIIEVTGQFRSSEAFCRIEKSATSILLAEMFTPIVSETCRQIFDKNV